MRKVKEVGCIEKDGRTIFTLRWSDGYISFAWPVTGTISCERVVHRFFPRVVDIDKPIGRLVV